MAIINFVPKIGTAIIQTAHHKLFKALIIFTIGLWVLVAIQGVAFNLVNTVVTIKITL